VFHHCQRYEEVAHESARVQGAGNAGAGAAGQVGGGQAQAAGSCITVDSLQGSLDDGDLMLCSDDDSADTSLSGARMF
jgi:hypothetical protein